MEPLRRDPRGWLRERFDGGGCGRRGARMPGGVVRALVVLGRVLAGGGRTSLAQRGGQSPGGRAPVSKADVDRWMTELSNWGRWGPDDQLGALNLITPAKRRPGPPPPAP